MPESENDNSSLELVSKIVSAYVIKNNLSASELPQLIRTVHEALKRPGQAGIAQAEPAVPIKRRESKALPAMLKRSGCASIFSNRPRTA